MVKPLIAVVIYLSIPVIVLGSQASPLVLRGKIMDSNAQPISGRRSQPSKLSGIIITAPKSRNSWQILSKQTQKEIFPSMSKSRTSILYLSWPERKDLH